MNEQELRAELDRRFAEAIANAKARQQSRARVRNQFAEARRHGLTKRHQRKERIT